jgi:hypothetical protein
MAEGSELSRIDDAAMATTGGGFNWVGINPAQMKSIAQAMALSGMFPDIVKDSTKAFVKIMAGQEMGIAPFQAMSDISIIQGKASAGGNIYASKIKASGRYDYRVKRWDREGCEIEFFEVIAPGKKESLGLSSFLKADAEDAQLINKENWRKYPRNMYFNRAITAGVRTFCPDVLGGVNAYTPDELGATVDEEGRVISVPNQTTSPDRPDPKPAAKKAADRGDVIDGELADNKTVLQMIGEELEAKGFDDKLERQKIAFAVGNVSAVNHLNDEEWFDVYESIQQMSTEELSAMIKAPLPADEEDSSQEPLPPEPPKSTEQALADGDDMPDGFLQQGGDAGVDVSDEDLAAVGKAPLQIDPQFVVPEFKKGSSSMARPDMIKLYKKWLKELGLSKAEDIAGFCNDAIGKKAPATFDDYQNALEALAELLNNKSTQEAIV